MTRANPHIATPYELEAAAERRLKAIAFPLLPEPTKEGNTWVWPCSPIDLFWFQSEEVGDRLLKKLPWQEGDRIYFQEEWVALHTPDLEPWTCMAKSAYYAEGYKDEDYPSMDGYYPAKTMEQNIAQHWFTIAKMQVMQMKDITPELQVESGLIRGLPRGEITEEQRSAFTSAGTNAAMHHWNAAYPQQVWQSDRWVVVLKLEFDKR